MEEMNNDELKKIEIEKYANLMRIKKNQPKDIVNEELEYQIKICKASLSTFGVNYKDLEF